MPAVKKAFREHDISQTILISVKQRPGILADELVESIARDPEIDPKEVYDILEWLLEEHIIERRLSSIGSRLYP